MIGEGEDSVGKALPRSSVESPLVGGAVCIDELASLNVSFFIYPLVVGTVWKDELTFALGLILMPKSNIENAVREELEPKSLSVFEDGLASEQVEGKKALFLLGQVIHLIILMELRGSRKLESFHKFAQQVELFYRTQWEEFSSNFEQATRSLSEDEALRLFMDNKNTEKFVDE